MIRLIHLYATRLVVTWIEDFLEELKLYFNELAPTVSRDVIGRTIRVKPGNALDPINGKLRLRCCLFLLGLLIQLWQLPQLATASSKSGPQRLYTE